MVLDFENPFADYGTIVRGDRFIGRKNDLRVIENRVIRPNNPGNLAIIGIHRIGKSSLVYKSIMDRKDELMARRQLPIWINLAIYDQDSDFFHSLVTCSYEKMKDLGWLTQSIIYAAEQVLEGELSWSEEYGRIKRYFQQIRESGFGILFILDEFDNARNLFNGRVNAFQGLRDLSYEPEWRINYVTISRRRIYDIELQTRAISTFDLIFEKHYLGMFDHIDKEEYFNRISRVGIDITSKIKDQVDIYCGGHPYLMEMLGFEMVELFREHQNIDVDKTALQIHQSFIDQYDHIAQILSEDGSLKKLLQILFGPIVDVKQTDVEKFQTYHLIHLTEHGKYKAFSDHFQDYLKLIERQSDLWPLWRDTEISLRNVLTTTMVELYGEDWIRKLEKSHSQLVSIFDQCRVAQQKEEKSFKSRASCNLIDFTYPQDLFAMIFSEWNSFKEIFGNDKNKLQQRVQLLTKIRNPLAHNRFEVLQESDRQIAEGYCKEILELINIYMNKRNSKNHDIFE